MLKARTFGLLIMGVSLMKFIYSLDRLFILPSTFTIV